MEYPFQIHSLHFLKDVLHEVQNAEQTQELKLSDGMPDIARVISAWGQPILRSKEWHSDHISFTGGMMVWVLYQPEGENTAQVISSWVPFQLHWDFPELLPDGVIRIGCLPRFVDARSISPRKMILRCGLAVCAQALISQEVQIYTPCEENDDTELLRSRYGVKLPKLAEEKAFLLDETLTLPESAPKPQKIIYCTLDGKITDSRVLTDKLLFRGSGKMHTLYQSESGQLHSWDFDLPFSQFAELEQSFGANAQADLRLGVTNLEAELTDSGQFRIKCGIAAQYLISDLDTVEIAEDAYSVSREIDLSREQLELSGQLESKRETIYAEQTVTARGNLVADHRFLPDYPKVGQRDGMMNIEYPGLFQILYYGEDGQLYGTTARWETQEQMNAGEKDGIFFYPMQSDCQAVMGSDQITMKTDMTVEKVAAKKQIVPMVTQIQPGAERKPERDRPSLILQRAQNDSLWEIAKKNGASLDAIRKANGLEQEPVPGQILLIPIP